MASPRKPQAEKPVPDTRKCSLYRLKTPEGPGLDLRELVLEHHLQREGYSTHTFEHDGIEGLVVSGTITRGRADWCAVVERLTGISVQEANHAAAGLVLVRTERAVYALTYGVGHHMIDPFRLDSDFGLEFATRCLDDDHILLVRRQIMDARGRTDENATSRGERIGDFGIERVGAIITKISGMVSTLPLTYLDGEKRRTVRVVSSDSTIQLPLGTSPANFLKDLHAIEEVCARPDPLPELDFIDRIRALKGKHEVVQRLEARLEELLADTSSPRLAVSVPSECLDDYAGAQTYRITKGARSEQTPDLELKDLLALVHERPAGNRLKALKDVQVQMFSDADGELPASGKTSGHRWLIADVPMGAGRYFYCQGRWYEIGADYLTSIEEELTELFDRQPSVTMPPWSKGDEGAYNIDVAEQKGYTLFDKKSIVTPKFRGGGLEICDVLGPRNQLICVKQAKDKTAPLNHLFAQGRVAVEVLRNDPQVRAKFLAALAEHNPNHPVQEDLGAVTLVYAILLKDGQDITVNSLFAFAQVSLLQAVHQLRAMNARVEIVAIRR